MKTTLRSSLLVGCAMLVSAACSTPRQRLPRVEAPPPRLLQESAKERHGDTSAAVDEHASRRWLDEQIELRAAEGPIKPPPPPEVHVVRVPYAPSYDYSYGVYGDDAYAGYSHGYDDHRYYYDQGPYRPGYRRPRFGLGNTLLGAGLGAIIGHQSGRRDRGAAIGAGLGLLFDLSR